MKRKKILVPTDFSRCSEASMKYATILAREWGATLVIVHVEESPLTFGSEMYFGVLEPDRVELQKMLCRVRPSDADIPCQRRLLRGGGDPAERIAAFARKIKADLIVMGTHGRTGLKRQLMGSVAEAVVGEAPCPILVMRDAIRRPVLVAG